MLDYLVKIIPTVDPLVQVHQEAHPQLRHLGPLCEFATKLVLNGRQFNRVWLRLGRGQYLEERVEF